jgi:hypothetical protein
LVLVAALATGSLLAVASVGAVAALVALVAVLRVERVEARVTAYEGFTRTWRGVAFSSIVGLAAFALFYWSGSAPTWWIVVPPIWGAGLALNVWRLVRHNPEQDEDKRSS